MSQLLSRLNRLLSSEFGIDIRRTVRSLRGLPYYLRDYRRYRRGYAGKLGIYPCLSNRFEQGGAVGSEYFWQDLLVARRIFQRSPERHVDVGSRVDGFVAHVASFRDIEVLDVRPIVARVPGIIFRQADVMRPQKDLEQSCDSLSCLHALEHFGLGRYGDPIDPNGMINGLRNLAAMVREGGTLYLSVPIGAERVEFNAHRVSDPRKIVKWATEHGMVLEELYVIDRGGYRSSDVDDNALATLSVHRYALGLFIFGKRSQSVREDMNGGDAVAAH